MFFYFKEDNIMKFSHIVVWVLLFAMLIYLAFFFYIFLKKRSKAKKEAQASYLDKQL